MGIKNARSTIDNRIQINVLQAFTYCGADGVPRLPCLRRYYQVNANGGQGTHDLLTASQEGESR